MMARSRLNSRRMKKQSLQYCLGREERHETKMTTYKEWGQDDGEELKKKKLSMQALSSWRGAT